VSNDEREPAPPPAPSDWQEALRSHPRSWQSNLYVYPVLSRRARGISIGININPDQVCNFNCVYCQVRRGDLIRTRTVDLEVMRRELHQMLEQVSSGALFVEKPFADAPVAMRRVSDVAFSGDGEPTLSKVFPQAASIVADARGSHPLPDDMKIVLLTNAGFLDRPVVRDAIDLLHAHGGVLWAKLDAGTEEHFRRMNRCHVSLARIVENITFAAQHWRVLIQSMWLRVQDRDPDPAEVDAFADRLAEILRSGGTLQGVQVYTLARPPAEDYVSGLPEPVLQRIADTVAARTHLPVEVFPSPENSRSKT
jgi:wyosine [tRNA(Phe)-imidazoG37] synthetase (radical SAM superfamily)